VPLRACALFSVVGAADCVIELAGVEPAAAGETSVEIDTRFTSSACVAAEVVAMMLPAEAGIAVATLPGGCIDAVAPSGAGAGAIAVTVLAACALAGCASPVRWTRRVWLVAGG